MSETPKFSIGQLVNRIEDREYTLATVLEYQYIEYDGFIYYISYVEGGSGYWPQDCLTAA